jgi:hypothetical protein
MFKIFGHDFFEKADSSTRPPFLQGVLTYHPETLEPEFDITDDGPFHLWFNLDSRGRPPRHNFVGGADICTGLAGSYTSNSVLTFIDTNTMTQAFSFASNSIPPSDFADLAIAASKWLNDALLAWEHNGPGSGFTKRVIDKRYGHTYFRTILTKKSKRKTKELGWWTDPRSKEIMFSEFSRTVRRGELTLYDDKLVEECGQYVRGANGKIVHIQQARTEDVSSQGEAHGDRVIAACVCLQAVRDRPARAVKEDEDFQADDPPPYTMAARQKEYEDAQKAKDEAWDDRTNWDMTRRI